MGSMLKDILALAMLESTFINPNRGSNNLGPKDVSGKKYDIIPKGCTTYYFDSDGWVNTEEEFFTNSPYSFKCVSHSEKAARKKYEKWRTKL